MTVDHVREPLEDLRVARGDSEEEVWAKHRDRRAQARAEAACDWVYRGSHRRPTVTGARPGRSSERELEQSKG